MTAAPVPRLALEDPTGPQLDAFLALTRQRAVAADQLAACQTALLTWAGLDVPLSVVTLLQTGEVPRAVTDAVWAQQEAERRGASLQRELEERQAQRTQRTAEYTDLQARRAAHDRESADLQARAALRPAADRLTTVRARLAQALTRQAAQQGRGLATLWSAVSGQAGALQREVDQARADEVTALLAYESCAQQQGVLPVPDPADLPAQVTRDHLRLTEQKRVLAQQQHAAQMALRALDDQDDGTRAALRTLRQQSASVWRAAQQSHALPSWDRWMDLWRRREDARPLWAQHAAAKERLQTAAAALERHLTTFPPHLRDPAEVTRQFGALRDAAAARERAEQQAGRAALVITLQARAGALERARAHEARVRHEAAMRAEAQREAQRRQEELACTREARLPLLDALHGRLAHLQLSAARVEAEAQVQPERAGSAAHPRTAADEVLTQSGAQDHLSPLTAEPVIPLPEPTAPLSPGHPSDQLDAPRTAPNTQISGPILGESERTAAQALLVRHAAVAAQAAMCLEALVDWAGPGVTGEDALRLADRISRTPPEGEPDAVPPTVPADVPVTPGHWHHLWTVRERGAALRRSWLKARATTEDLEGQMAPLWAAWPAGTRHVAALRQATKAAGRAAPAAPVTPGPVLPPPAPREPGTPQRADPSSRTPTTTPPAARSTSPGPWTTPHLTPEQVPAARALLARLDAARERERRTLDALAAWAGPGLNGPRLAQLVSGPLPGEITQALSAWARTQHIHVAHEAPDRTQIAAAVQAEKDRSAAVLGPLRQLQVHAGAVIQAEHALAGTRPSAIPRAQRRLQDARAAYATQAAELGVSPAPSPRRIAALIQDELTTFNRRLQRLDAQWKALVGLSATPPAPDQPGTWKRAWAAVSDRYGLPLHPDTWEQSLWPRRAEAEQLWTALQAVQQQVQAAQEDLTVLCATWPAGARTVDTLRQVAGRITPPTVPPQTRPTRAPAAPTRPVPAPVAPDVPRAAPASPARPAPTAPPRPTPTPPAQVPNPTHSAQPTTVPPAPVAQPSPPTAPVPTRPMPSGAVPNLVLRPVPSPTAPDMRPAVMPPTTPEMTPPAAVPVAPLSVATAPLLRSPTSPPPAPTNTPLRPPAPPARSMPLPPLPAARPAAPEPLSAPATGRLTRRQRAEREAVRLSDQYDWESGFHLIADALDRDRWGQLRESIEREIALGMTPDEFELLLQLRAYWHDQTHYQSPYTARYDSLPWSLGTALIRRCAGVPCLDEMILLLERLYEYAQIACSARSLPAFSQRLGAILDRADPDVDLDYWLSTREER
ncbi:hypothetical protein GCM10008956_36150 [Deinococcus arenae]|uniref:Uncharacterized protein n=1 Tax=Deinococcus arenae TaxID=1452751 RepID=A0A8H9GSI1_9DEIO|nr:hypothetical protein GCM10008956_36150 [Deinococcus arenae]